MWPWSSRGDGVKTTVTHYRDGQTLATQTIAEPFHSGAHDLLLGSYGGLHFLNGAINEVKIWDRPLTPDEIHNEARR